MYRAKWGGKSRYLVFESGMEDEVQSRLELEMDLQGALDNEEFFLVYQPTFDLQTMTPTGVEALIRWRRPGRGIVQPEEFIPLLEETKHDRRGRRLGAARRPARGGRAGSEEGRRARDSRSTSPPCSSTPTS